MAKAFASKAQMERCKRLVEEGKMTQESYMASLALTPNPEQLPERLHPKKEPKEKAESEKENPLWSKKE